MVVGSNKTRSKGTDSVPVDILAVPDQTHILLHSEAAILHLYQVAIPSHEAGCVVS